MQALPARVLLVDDNPTLLRVLAETLRNGPDALLVDTCESASQALLRISETEYDVVLTDVLMPDIDGLELLRRVRELLPDSLTVLITGGDDRELAFRALRGGAYDLIQKPVDACYLVACVGRAVETRRLRRAVHEQKEALREHAADLERLVEERTAQLREADRVKDEFLATVSHELRTPLTSILGWARLLRRGRLDAETLEHALESMERNARSQSQLIDDLLDVSRIITGKLRLDVQRVWVHDIVDAALEVVLPAAQAKNITVDSVLEKDLGAISADPERLQQILWNLLSNAIKFTPDGGRVEVGARRAGPHVELSVSDNGVGIEPTFLPFVFERFRQGNASLHWSRRGLGLWLGIVRHLVDLHGGSVSAASAGEGAGATFKVTLPAVRASVHTSSPSTKRRASKSRGVERLSECLRGVRVLVAEDQPDVRRVLDLTLRHAGAEVTTAATAGETMAAMARSTPDVLLLDIGLPDRDGFSLIQEVRSLPVERGGLTPAIALTAFAKPEDRRRALAAGFQLHMPKPGPPDLAAVIATVAARGVAR